MHRRSTYKHDSRTPLIIINKDNITLPTPLMGGGSIPRNTMPSDLAAWIKYEHRVPILLAISLYETPIEEMGGYMLHALSSERVGCWFRPETDTWIIGCRGTDFFSSTGASDILDDKKIAFGTYCDLTLVEEASKKLEWLFSEEVEVEDITVVGHSLGGTAALCLSSKYGMECISFNAGASPTNPVIRGPGPQLAIHYHIVGDLISSHMSASAARVIRIFYPEYSKFGTFTPHSSQRLLANNGTWKYMTADEEDTLYLEWARKFKFGWAMISAIFTLGTYLAHLKKYDIAKKSPIPDSIRALLRN